MPARIGQEPRARRRAALDWVALDWVERDWAALDWAALDWAALVVGREVGEWGCGQLVSPVVAPIGQEYCRVRRVDRRS